MKKLYTTAIFFLLTSGILFLNFLQMVELKAQSSCTAVSVSADSTIIGSGSSVKLTATGGTSFASNAISFDGVNDYVNIPHSAALDPAVLTVETWFNIPAFPTGGDTRRWIVNKNTHEWTQGHYSLTLMNNQVGAYLNIGGGSTNVKSATSTIPGGISINTWYHLAMTYDGVTLKVYLDTALVASTTVNLARVAGTGPINIGARCDKYNYTNIITDEVRIWNVVRTAAQIKASMNSSVPTNSTGLVGYWKMDEGTGTTTADATGNGHTGTLTSGPLWVTSAAAIYPVFSWSPKASLSDTTGADVFATPTTETTYTVTAAATGTCSASISTITIGITGVNQIETELKDFTLSPNPSNGKVEMSFVASKKDDYQMEVMNYIGQIVYSEAISTLEGSYSRTFDFTRFEKGVYLISLKNSNSQSTRRIVIE